MFPIMVGYNKFKSRFTTLKFADDMSRATAKMGGMSIEYVVYYVLMMSENQKFIDFTRSHPNRN